MALEDATEGRFVSLCTCAQIELDSNQAKIMAAFGLFLVLIFPTRMSLRLTSQVS